LTRFADDWVVPPGSSAGAEGPEPQWTRAAESETAGAGSYIPRRRSGLFMFPIRLSEFLGLQNQVRVEWEAYLHRKNKNCRQARQDAPNAIPRRSRFVVSWIKVRETHQTDDQPLRTEETDARLNPLPAGLGRVTKRAPTSGKASSKIVFERLDRRRFWSHRTGRWR